MLSDMNCPKDQSLRFDLYERDHARAHFMDLVLRLIDSDCVAWLYARSRDARAHYARKMEVPFGDRRGDLVEAAFGATGSTSF